MASKVYRPDSLGQVMEMNHSALCFKSHKEFRPVKEAYNVAKDLFVSEEQLFQQAVERWHKAKENFRNARQHFRICLEARQTLQKDCPRCELNRSLTEKKD